MSSNPNPDTNQPPNDGTRARANTAASTMPTSSTIGSMASPVPSTPNLQRDGGVAEYTPAGHDDIATPPTQPFSRLSISTHRTLDLVDRVGDINEPKVPHQLAASAQIESADTLSSPPSVFTHGSLGADDHTEAVQRSPDSDPFEYDDNASTHSPVASPELSTHSNQVEENDDANVAQHLPTSDQPYSDGTLPTNTATDEPVEDDNLNAVQQPSTLQDSTLDQSESTGSISTNPTTVDTTPNLTAPADSPLEQFRPLVQALAELSPPFTFDGDIVMPDDQHLKLQIWQKGYKPTFGPQPAAPRNRWAKAAKVEPYDMSKEWCHDFRPKDHGSKRQAPLSWNSVTKIGAINLAIGGSSQGDKVSREMKSDPFALEPDIIAQSASNIVHVIKKRLGLKELPGWRGEVSLGTSNATLRLCKVDAWHGTDVSADGGDRRRIGTVVLGIPVMSEKGDIVVQKTIKSDSSVEGSERNAKVVFDWAKQWTSQDPADVRPRWMFFPSGTRYAIEDTCPNENPGHAKSDVHFVIEYPVYIVDPDKKRELSNLTKPLVSALHSMMDSADRDFTISFVLSRPAAKLGDGNFGQLETELGKSHSIQPDAILYKALKIVGLAPTFEHVDNEPINPVSENYPRVMSAGEVKFPARVRDEAKRVISLTYDKSKPVVLIGAPILDNAENVGGRVVMTVEIPKAKVVGQKEDVGKKVQTGLDAH